MLRAELVALALLAELPDEPDGCLHVEDGYPGWQGVLMGDLVLSQLV